VCPVSTGAHYKSRQCLLRGEPRAARGAARSTRGRMVVDGRLRAPTHTHRAGSAPRAPRKPCVGASVRSTRTLYLTESELGRDEQSARAARETRGRRGRGGDASQHPPKRQRGCARRAARGARSAGRDNRRTHG
jgi:hypothetical protein